MLDFNEFNLLLIRHGQSAVNVLPDQMGQAPDVPLTPHGIDQAKRLGHRLLYSSDRLDCVYSSHYTRALHTAKLATMDEEGKHIIVCPDLREYSAGDWEGAKRSEVLNPSVIARMGYMDNAFLPPGGESMNQVERRASLWMEQNILYNKEKIEEAARRRDEKKPKMNIAVFSHGMTIKCLLHHIMGFDKSFTWKLTLENTSISKLVFREEGWKLITINDHAHLL
jgi:broad specificity phosphatase PhoE